MSTCVGVRGNVIEVVVLASTCVGWMWHMVSRAHGNSEDLPVAEGG